MLGRIEGILHTKAIRFLWHLIGVWGWFCIYGICIFILFLFTNIGRISVGNYSGPEEEVIHVIYFGMPRNILVKLGPLKYSD
jgi:hypothetical protein